MKSMTVTFRGYQTTIVVDSYHEDISTNSCEVEWHFEDMTPEDRADLHVSDEEEEAIIQQIHVFMGEHEADAFEGER